MANEGVDRLSLVRRLGSSWQELALVLEIPPHEQRRFTPGDEAHGILTWLAERDRLADLPAGLRTIGRADLAVDAERGQRTGRGRRIVVLAVAALVTITAVATWWVLRTVPEGKAGAAARRSAAPSAHTTVAGSSGPAAQPGGPLAVTHPPEGLLAQQWQRVRVSRAPTPGRQVMVMVRDAVPDGGGRWYFVACSPDGGGSACAGVSFGDGGTGGTFELAAIVVDDAQARRLRDPDAPSFHGLPADLMPQEHSRIYLYRR